MGKYILRFPFILSFLFVFITQPLFSEVIDTFDYPGDWQTTGDGTAVVTADSVSGQRDQALELTYNLNDGSFISIEKNINEQNFSGTGFRFYYRATGGVNDIEINFRDNDVSTVPASSDWFNHRVSINPDNNWHEVVVPFTDITNFFSTGNGNFNTGEVTLFALGVNQISTAATSGTIFFDEFRIYQNTGGTTTDIDTFENGALVNSLGQAVAVSTGGAGSSVSLVKVTTQAVNGSQGLEMKYTVDSSAGWAGVNQSLGTISAASTRFSHFIEFYARGSVGGENLDLELVGGGNLRKLALSTYGSLTTSFKKFRIPLMDFNNNDGQTALDFTSLTLFSFTVDTPGESGTIYFDDLKIVPPEVSRSITAEDFTLDIPQSFFTPNTSGGDFTFNIITDETVPGASGGNNVLSLDYSFSSSSGGYAVFEKELRPNFLTDPGLSFNFKGTGGDNTLEISLFDDDGTRYFRRFSKATNTNDAWRFLKLSLRDFTELAAGDTSGLNLAKIQKVVIAVLSGSDPDKIGTITFDDLATTSGIAFEKFGVGSILTRVSTPHNPFSPNGDGTKDKAQFSYTLSQASRIKLTIFNLRGVPIKVIDKGEQQVGTHLIEWDGITRDGRTLKNGVYLFHIEADGVGGGKDTFQHVMGSLR